MDVSLPTSTAQLVASIHQPWRASVDDCLDRWSRLDAATRGAAYLVIEGPEPSRRRTLNASSIAELAGGRPSPTV
ncbi:hypothetical protein FHT00_000908 [Sphingomonas insulae]|uniref:Uncharacterized protein n=1 Tax=Sphingomonas insulae TaxID=424800 RepID=A0ABP3T2K0_9SPHN|nr:hypothetical protein [Sphingomonas insulae]NIJ28975.1 hypothetical protein [Sphingomonas insulae]